MSIEGAGGPYGKPAGEFAEMRFAPDGALTLFIGSGDSGQGHRTTFSQLAGELLGLDAETITVETGDTDLVKDGFGSTGSRTVIAAGTAVVSVAEEIIRKGRELAAADLEADVGDIEFAAGTFKVVGTDRQVSLTDLAARHHDSLHAEGDTPPKDATFPNGCHICEVEIDPETGACVLDRYVVVDDVGTVINPLLMKGQMHGGIAQGVGQGLMEKIVYDDSGQMLSASFVDYQMPRATDFPMFDVRSNPVPTPNNPLGAKGAGEAGTVGGLPVVISAVCDALAPYGVSHLDMPATPERIWRAIHQD
jgi:carbon-monoxide dehydrogenase large subunit